MTNGPGTSLPGPFALHETPALGPDGDIDGVAVLTQRRPRHSCFVARLSENRCRLVGLSPDLALVGYR